MPANQQIPITESIRKWLPLIVFAIPMISGDAVQAYQIEQHEAKIETVQDVVKQQAVTENEIKHIKEDVESLDDTMRDLDDKVDGLNGKMDIILQRLSN